MLHIIFQDLSNITNIEVMLNYVLWVKLILLDVWALEISNLVLRIVFQNLSSIAKPCVIFTWTYLLKRNNSFIKGYMLMLLLGLYVRILIKRFNVKLCWFTCMQLFHIVCRAFNSVLLLLINLDECAVLNKRKLEEMW